jgi:phage-related minor tail protein
MSSGNGRQLDELADLVVERIEQRVIDELERRGRRGVPGAF